MKINYHIKIENPSTHQVLVRAEFPIEKDVKNLSFFLPRWSPGSYLIREYSRHLSKMKVTNEWGEVVYFEQIETSVWSVQLDKVKTQQKTSKVIVEYQVYCHELTVRTSHVDQSHAFLQLPCLLVGVIGMEMPDPTLKLEFPAIWTKVSTGLKDISPTREQFLYTAANYDELIDGPIEIGCHQTDGFMLDGIEHEIASYGQLLPHGQNLKEDTKKIISHIAHFFGGFPYQKYTIINHFVPGLYGGLEHLNSTALHFCPTNILQRKSYINYLALVSHEYFHTWNVKRIRPIELGPFNYLKEAMTKLLWLAEGLTSLMDELFIYRADVITLEEYLEMQKDNLNRYLSVPGRRFHSLQESSLNAWIKLYRPDENTNNSSVSYYLKGGIVFWCVNILFHQQGKSINDLLKALWERHLKQPNVGVTDDEVYEMVESIAGKQVREKFEEWVTTTVDINFDDVVKLAGLEIDWDKTLHPWVGIDSEYHGDRVHVKSIHLDGPAYKAGVNAHDEIIAVNGMRVLKDRWNDLARYVQVNQAYDLTVSRLGQLLHLKIVPENAPSKIRQLKVVDKTLLENVLRH